MSPLRRIARQALASFTAWRHRRRVERADPELARLARLASEQATQHRKAAQTRRQLHDRVLANLLREQGKRQTERLFS